MLLRCAAQGSRRSRSVAGVAFYFEFPQLSKVPHGPTEAKTIILTETALGKPCQMSGLGL